jgi:hypothetical protein
MSQQIEVLLLGEPKLRQVSENVLNTADIDFISDRQKLELALDHFRKKHGFGRYYSCYS